MDGEHLSQTTAEDATDFFSFGGYTESIFTMGGGAMTVYLDLVILLNFLVDWLLLMGTNRIVGYPYQGKRTALAAALGAGYAALCLLPGFEFMGNAFWRIVSLGGMAAISFGWNFAAVRRGLVFVLLSMALGGLALGIGKGGFSSIVLGAAGLAGICALGFKTPPGMQKYQPIEIQWQGKKLAVMALVDTGNTLRDPITGEVVTVLGADMGEKLGIPKELLNDPVATLMGGKLPGARLIPYRAVGQSGGMLLGLKMEQVRLNNRDISPIVAIARERIGRGEGYQALAGGIL